MKKASKRPQILFVLALLLGLGLAAVLAAIAYRPDRPVATIVPGSSSAPAFVVQIIRPRAGLPLGGLLPPRLFGIDEELRFDTSSAGASVGGVSAERVELAADDWELVLVLDSRGRVLPGTQVVFDLVFEERLRRVRCRPADPAVGTVSLTRRSGAAELSGHFDIELPRCDDAATGESLGWPPQPFVLHGSFDRLPLDAAAK